MGTIGERVRQLRKTAGMTQPVLAKAIGIDQSTLSDIERGSGFSAEILMRLAEQLGSSCEYIMRGHQAADPRYTAAQQAVRKLSDEQRLELFTALMQPPVQDHEVEKRMPATARRATVEVSADDMLHSRSAMEYPKPSGKRRGQTPALKRR